MKSVIEIFKDCNAAVEDDFAVADASEKLRASLALTDLTLRTQADLLNHERWKMQMEAASAVKPQSLAE